jgi:hypothetical protein
VNDDVLAAPDPSETYIFDVPTEPWKLQIVIPRRLKFTAKSCVLVKLAATSVIFEVDASGIYGPRAGRKLMGASVRG